MTRYALALVFLACAVSAEAVCRTEVYPENAEDRPGFPMFLMAPGRTTVVQYTPPITATSVGLEFWSHLLPLTPEFPARSLSLSTYHYVPSGVGPRLLVTGISQNTSSNWDNFAMSTFLHQGETLVVSALNETSEPAPYFLAVTIRICE